VRCAADAGAAAFSGMRASTSRRLRLRRRFDSDVERATAAVGNLREWITQASAGEPAASNVSGRTQRRMWAAALGSAGLAAAVAVAVMAGGIARGGAEPPAEGILGAAFPQPTPPRSPAPAASGPDATVVPSQAERASVTAIQFDDVRMSSGLGAGWSVEPIDAVVGIAAVPNAVDRSARLGAGDSPTRACRPLAETIAAAEASYDILVESGITTAEVTLAGDPGGLTITLSGEGGQVSSGADPVASLPAIEADTWYRVTVDIERAHVRIVNRQSSASARDAEFSASLTSTRFETICIATAGDSGAASYFDNITVQSEGSHP